MLIEQQRQQDSQVTNSGTQSPSDSVNASSISDPPKDQGADMAAPYGTRSRNRGGRVNYAEDKDIDTDVYDYYDKKDQEGSKKPARKSDAGTNGETTLRPVGSRRAAAEEAKAANASSQNCSRDTTLGVVAGASQSTLAPGATQGTRKRKAAVAAAAATAQAAAAAAAGTAATASATAVSTATGALTKRNGQVVHAAATSWPDTNMLTFENCGQRMNGDKRMVADDGTVLEANGECAHTSGNASMTWTGVWRLASGDARLPGLLHHAAPPGSTLSTLTLAFWEDRAKAILAACLANPESRRSCVPRV